jgi:hypothetical protein
MCAVKGQRDCSCCECKRHNDALFLDVAVDDPVDMTEVYVFEPFDSLAVGYDFTAAKFAKGNRIISTNAWKDKHLQIAASKNLRLRPMILGTDYAFLCQWASATDRHMQCLTLLADNNSSKLCLSWLNMESPLSVNNILSNVYIDYAERMKVFRDFQMSANVSLDQFHSCSFDLEGFHALDFFNDQYYTHQFIHAPKSRMEIMPQVENQEENEKRLQHHLYMSADMKLAWAMTQHPHMDIWTMIYKAWRAAHVNFLLGPRAVCCLRKLLEERGVDYDSLDGAFAYVI